MTTTRSLVRVLALVLLAAGLLASPLFATEQPLDQGPEIIRGENDVEWQPVFDALAANETVFAKFTERRWFRVRRQPVVLEGELRLMTDRDLSLHYSDRTIVIDEQGILVRDARGRTRHVRHEEKTQASNTWLLAVMRFDRAELEEKFRLHGARATDRWRLDFIPRDATTEDVVGAMVVHGSGEAITRIEMHPQPELRVEIRIEETQTDVTFSEADLRRFFR